MKYVVKGNYICGGHSSVRTVNGVDAARHQAKNMMQSGNFDELSIIVFRMNDKKRLDISDITGVIDMEVEA